MVLPLAQDTLFTAGRNLREEWRRRETMTFAVIGLALLLTPASRQDTAWYVSRIGRDTVAIERVVRTPGRIEGVLVTRTPRTGVMAYWAELDADGRITRASVEQRLN